MSRNRRQLREDADRRIQNSPWRWLISGLLLLHLTAVFIAPFTFASASEPGNSSPLAAWVMETMRPYIDAAFLNHGYFFFAPNPGASHLVRYEAEFDDGRETIEGRFPDLRQQWPRLLYHRHFMLSESLHSRFVPPEIPPDVPPNSAQRLAWQRQRDFYEAMWQSFQNRLSVATGADRVHLTRVEHRPPSPFEFLEEQVRLDDQRLFFDLPEAVDAIMPRPLPTNNVMTNNGMVPQDGEMLQPAAGAELIGPITEPVTGPITGESP